MNSQLVKRSFSSYKYFSSPYSDDIDETRGEGLFSGCVTNSSSDEPHAIKSDDERMAKAGAIVFIPVSSGGKRGAATLPHYVPPSDY